MYLQGGTHRIPQNLLEGGGDKVLLAHYGKGHTQHAARVRTLQSGKQYEPRSATTAENNHLSLPFDVIVLDIWHPGKSAATKTKTVRALVALDLLRAYALGQFVQSLDSAHIATMIFTSCFRFTGLPKLVIIDSGLWEYCASYASQEGFRTTQSRDSTIRPF